ncbi:bifunctional cobalt-precorrin-7 (C(5))-methyltransferase CbiE/decarboxylating cobalt-precorrin-6B (C(15))-methyltransferase CbiT, partial [Saccharopolyspora sp.]|uniref:bifunctional cobalt-precorrin-7 (C(5))-methyltransferase/cobalt-precorrin-6B (C(15))-methyltransferase n=1 Tax=Saccharopolyspora sp. TaxID=33915 RepID=UPI0025E33F06
RARRDEVGDVTVTVVGIDGAGLPAGVAEALGSARLVVGARRNLNAHAPEQARTLELEPLESALGALSALAGAETGVVLVDGDPGFFGVLRSLRDRGIRCSVLPAASAVAKLMAHIGRPWEDVPVAVPGEQDLPRVINLCRARPAVLVLTAPDAGPAQLASGLAGWRRTLLVGEDVGGPDEKFTPVDPAEAATRTWAANSVVLCTNQAHEQGPRSWLSGGEWLPDSWGLSEDEFSHRDGDITPAEVRAVALAELAPRPGTLVWDVGAGSGSVAVECARMGSATVAVESDEAQVVRLVTNAAGHGVDVRVEEGEAPKSLRELPKPDAVFVGGGGADVVTACAHAGASRVVIELTELERVGPTRDALRAAGYEVRGVQLAASRLVELDDGGSKLEPAAAVVVVSGRRKEP